MTRDEFAALPLPLALRVLFDALPEGARQSIEDAHAPRVPSSPKFDNMLFTNGGIVWASECDAGQLRYHLGRARQSSKPEYAEADAKKCKALEYWIEWRAYYPQQPWTGERNHQTVTGAVPSAKPRVYQRDENRGAAAPATTERKAAPAFDDGPSEVDNDEIPF